MKKFMKLFIKEIQEIKVGFVPPAAILLALAIIFTIEYPDNLDSINWDNFYLFLGFAIGVIGLIIFTLVIRCLILIKMRRRRK